MVDKRQMLQSNVEADLKKKIESAQKVLGELKHAVHQVETNSAKVKGEVNQAVESIKTCIGNRKLELSREIDIISKKQISSLQESIEATCIALGSLCSTLSNLDSFDHTQLKNLRISELLPTCNGTPPLDLKINNSILDKEIRIWGSVSSKGIDLTTSTRQKSVPYKNFSGTSPATEFEILNIDKWLLGVHLESALENDEFEIVMMDGSDKEPNMPARDLSCPMDKSLPSSNASVLNDEQMNDLSKWLKPKKLRNPLDTTENNCNKAYIHNPLKNRYIDFPCLRTDPNTWIPSKRTKTMKEGNLAKNIFPPEYELPTPFWLKRNC